ncbi:uncharacterized protein SETTUDRAFT_162473 [Exserohilum turcica Et28A]|uniref:Uncharacterized protein n=1 Tax=Exserohilum turcicum (strain 28A) TaxID=671987 RepID=R0J592_EXST2|nr:uncharacterized protein SETTUDRAFT_162473 [Exserohilum turcica Et28A]EOA91911.1 hypothetical protein SETTUDRAFT_162473 [Exserohilum turcica Et28A]
MQLVQHCIAESQETLPPKINVATGIIGPFIYEYTAEPRTGEKKWLEYVTGS